MLTKKMSIVNEVAMTICEILLVLMVLFIFLQIVSRTFFSTSFSWTEEVARYMFIYVVFLAAAVAFGSKAHISVDILYMKVKKTYRKLLCVISALCVSLIGGLFLVEGLTLVQKTMVQASPGLGIKMGYVYIILPVAGALMILNIWAYTIDYLRGKIMDNERGAEAEEVLEKVIADTGSLLVEGSRDMLKVAENTDKVKEKEHM